MGLTTICLPRIRDLFSQPTKPMVRPNTKGLKMKRMVRVVCIVFLATFPLMGAKCEKKVDNEYKCASSKKLRVVPGAGMDWAYGSFPFSDLSFAGDLFLQVNAQRRGEGLPELIWHDGIAVVAQKHSIDMFNRNYLSLVTPEGVDLCERLVSSNPRIDFDEGYHFVSFTQTPTRLFSDFMDNPDTRAAIRDPGMTHFGASFWQNPGPFKVTVIFLKNATP